MSEIEKMYENAGIKPTKNWQSCLNCELKTETRYDEWGEPYLTCNRLEMPEKCPDAKEYYPPFTVEKQIELIKWLILNYSTEITKGRYTNYFMSTGRSYKASGNDDLIICMANLINNLWQDLTEEERKQLKEILE